MSLDGKDAGPLALNACARAKFNRFGLRTARPGGQSQLVYFDDVSYTAAPASARHRETKPPGTTPTGTPNTGTGTTPAARAR